MKTKHSAAIAAILISTGLVGCTTYGTKTSYPVSDPTSVSRLQEDLKEEGYFCIDIGISRAGSSGLVHDSSADYHFCAEVIPLSEVEHYFRAKVEIDSQVEVGIETDTP